MKWLGRVFFVVVAVLTVVALLPTFGVVDHSNCHWEQQPGGTRNDDVTVEALKGVALTVRSNDADVGPKLRAALLEKLAARGVTDVVGNPLAKAQLAVTLNELNARWTPFFSEATVKVQAQLDLDSKRRGPRDADVTVTLTGGCTGLVKKDGWLDRPIADVVDGVVTQLLPR